jgi:hypothetical protein
MRAPMRTGRLILVAVVALFGLTGVQEPASPAPFGAATLVVEHGPLVDIWKNLRDQMVADDEAVSARLHEECQTVPRQKCCSVSLTTLRRYLGKPLWNSSP